MAKQPKQPESDQAREPVRKAPGRRRRAALAVFGLLPILVLLLQYFWLDRTVGSGPAGQPVERSRFSQLWSERRVLLLGLGDSVTAGFGASAGRSYFDRLARNPADEFADLRGVSLGAVLPALETRNASVSGSTSPEHLERQIERLPVFEKDQFGIVVMTTGGNDIIHDYGRSSPREGAMYGATMAQAKPWIENFEARLERMRTEIRQRFPGGCEIFLANIYDPTDGDGTAGVVGLPSWPDGLAILAEYNRRLERVAGRHADVHLVDIQSPLLGHGIYCRQFWRRHYQRRDPSYWYDSNFEDPNDRGYDAIRRAFLNRMAQVRERIAG